jgi:predicted PurR-regulated permease PerM
MAGPATSGEGDGFVRRVFIVAAVVVLTLLVWAWRHVFLLVFASVLIAVGLNALAMAIASRTPLSRPWALALSALLVVALIAGAVWLFGAQVGAQVRELGARIPEAWSDLRGLLADTPWGAEAMRQLQDNAASQGTQGALGALGRVGGWTMSIAGAALDAVVVFIGAIFLAVSPRPYREGVAILFPRRVRGEVTAAMDDAGRALAKWLLGTLISMTVVAVLAGITLWLLGVPAFLALALIAGLAQFLPLIGPLLASIPAVLLALTVGFDTALWVALAYFVISQLEANLITPLIQKRAVSLEPALMLFAILAMGLLLGPLGALLAIPLSVVATIFVIRFYVNGTLGESETPPGK